MHESSLVSLGERPARLTQEHDYALGWLGTETSDDVVQIESIQELHHVVEATGLVDAEIVELHGMRRPQSRGHLCFALEPSNQLLARRSRRDVVTNELYRRRTDEKPVPCEPDL